MKWEAEYKDETLFLSTRVQEGGADIQVHKSGAVRLFEIPLYGGTPRDYGTYPTVCHAIEVAEQWT